MRVERPFCVFCDIPDAQAAPIGIEHVPEVPRAELDDMASELSGQPRSWVRRGRGQE